MSGWTDGQTDGQAGGRMGGEKRSRGEKERNQASMNKQSSKDQGGRVAC